MPNTLAKYYTDELADWERTIAFYSHEIDALTLRLNEVIRRNSIPHIAEKVEVQQTRLDHVAEKFNGLQTQFAKQKGMLVADHSLIDDSLIDDSTGTRQKDLRERMLQSEKEYVEARTSCQLFLAEIFKSKNE